MESRRVKRGWRTRLRRFLPTAEAVRGNRWVGWIGPALHHPRLWHLNRRGVALGMAIGILLYAGVGVVAMLLGGNFLDYSVLAHESAHGQHRGIFLVELGVGITVTGVMLMIFYMFAGRSRSSHSEK